MKNMDAFQSLGLLTGSSSVDNELEIITTYSIMEKVVKDLELNVATKKDQFFNSVDQKIYDVPWKAAVTSYMPDAFENVGTYTFKVYTEDGKNWLMDGDNKQYFNWNMPVKTSVGYLKFALRPNRKSENGEWLLTIQKPSLTTENYI